MAFILGTASLAEAEPVASRDTINQPANLGSANEALTETNETLSTGGTLSIRDTDSPETFVARRNAKGKYGTFNIDKAGVWTYVTNGALDKIGEGQSVSDSFPVSSSDGTKTEVQITINGTNDPAVLGAPNVTLKEKNEPLKASGKLTIRDMDSPETFVEQSNVKGKNGTFSIDSGGAWTYDANSAFDELNEGQSVSDSFPVSSTDGTKTTVQVTINGTNDPAVLDSPGASLQETNEPLKASGKVSIRDVDSPETFVEQNNINGKTGTFSIDSGGAWTYVANSALDELSEGKSISDNFTVSSADGTKTSVKVAISGTNDAAILSSAAVTLDETNTPLSATGTLTISDVDSPQTFAAKKKIAGLYGSLSIDSNGRWKYVTNSALDELKEGQAVTDSFTVTSSDGTNTTVQVTINGTNDPAVLGSPRVPLKETNEPLKASGKVSIRDVDSPETFVAQSNVKGKNGTFSIDSGGAWTYVANSAFAELNAGQSVSDTFTVSSADGTQTTVKSTINGTNNPAVLGPAAVVLEETDEPLKPTGKLSIQDVDSPETFAAQSNVKGKNGTFSIDSAGAWTYIANSAFDKLNVGQSVSDSFPVSSADGTKTKVQVTINGTNDAAILSSATIALDETNSPLKTSGTLSIRDVDSPEKFVAQSNIKGANGTFSIDTSGHWTYVANSGFDELNVGQSVSDSFAVSSDDGTKTTVQVTINGTNDAAVLGIGYEVLTETNETLRTGGTLSIRDVDNPATFVAQDNVK
ncbi:MAG: VCBS domain-containing protein, partial [Gallionella sp.]